MSKFHDIDEAGFTVVRLYNHLKQAVEDGDGARRIYIGPTGGEDGNIPMAIPVVGIEANANGGPEDDIYWLYPGEDNEWQ